MHIGQIGRRRFLGTVALGSTGFVLANAAAGSAPASAVKIDEPFHGAVLNRRHGKGTAGGLAIRVAGRAPANDRVTVCGKPAQRQGEAFTAQIVLSDRETEIVAASEGGAGRREDRVRVVWDRRSFPRYRFSIDDNSFFLRDIFQKKYPRLFDCFYLAILRDLNRKYGVKFTVNIYYTTADGFDISQFPDRYRGQWRDCSDWLKLAFHAYADKPDRPYQDAPPEKLLADLNLVAEQIHRFAGPDSYAPPTVIHWAMTRQEALKPLFDHGIRVLTGDFIKLKGRWDINYRFDDVVSDYCSRHDAWKDFQSGIVFSKADITCNNVPVDKVVVQLAPLLKDPNQSEIMDLFTHEQYFWPFYRRYVPDHAQRLDAAIRWVTEHGFKPVFFHEGFLGAPI